MSGLFCLLKGFTAKLLSGILSLPWSPFASLPPEVDVPLPLRFGLVKAPLAGAVPGVAELAAGSPFTLVGGKLIYSQHAPGAELVYQVRQHKISVFIFQSRDVSGEPPANNQTFVVNGWQEGGLQYYIVTDASREDADRLRTLLQDANRS